MTTEEKIPGTLTIISILFYVSSGFSFLGGALFLAAGVLWKTIIQKVLLQAPSDTRIEQIPSFIIDNGGTLFLGIGLIIIAIGVWELFIGINLVKKKAWARTSAGILAGAGAALGLVSLMNGGVMEIGWNVLIIYILFFDKDVIWAFSNKSPYETRPT